MKDFLIIVTVMAALSAAYGFGKYDGARETKSNIKLFVEGYAAAACSRYEARAQ